VYGTEHWHEWSPYPSGTEENIIDMNLFTFQRSFVSLSQGCRIYNTNTIIVSKTKYKYKVVTATYILTDVSYNTK
jgi:hypothetical protein